MLKISFAGCLGLSPVISTQFRLEMSVGAPNREKSTTTPILGFKVVQGHRCCYHRKARPQYVHNWYDAQQVCVYLQPFSC